MRKKNITFPPNEVGRDFVVGDVHGMYDNLMDLLSSVNFDVEKDRCFSVGDLIDRGEKSAECLRLTNEDWFHPVYGNHEDLFLNALENEFGNASVMWHQNGGDWAYFVSAEDIEELSKIANTMPGFITIKHKSGKMIGICHAQPPTGDWADVVSEDLHDVELKSAIWGRTIANGSAPDGYHIDNIDLTIHGHCILDEPTRWGNSLFIDTGSFLSLEKYEGHEGNITILNLDGYLREEKL